MADTSESEALPQTNGLDNGLEEDDRMKMRPADIDADMREMERRKRVEMIMSSQLFREELERIIEAQMKDGHGPAGLLQQISDMMGVQGSRLQSTNFFRSSNCVVPINDIRGVESMGYAKGEKILRCKLAAVYRLMDLYGWTQNIYNHITARLNQDQEHFLINPFGLLYHEITASSLVKVDMQGTVVEHGTTNFGVNVAGFQLHAAVHAARPDVKCIIHLHTPSVLAVSSLKCGLLPLSQESVVIGEVSQHPFHGSPYEPEEKEKLARNLGPNNKVMFLTNHGALCCGETIEEAFYNVYNTVHACETQMKLMTVGIDNLVVIPDETRKQVYEAAHRCPEGTAPPPSIIGDKKEKKFRIGGLEFEALMRMLDNAGFRTGYIYRQPLVKKEPPRPRNDVEVPPAVSSLGYLLEEEEMYKSGNWKKYIDGRKSQDRTRWLNSPNVYQKVEILETGTPDPKKITKWVDANADEWVAEGSPTHSSTPVKIESALQFVPKGTNPKEFKKLQQQIKENRRADKITSGPQSHILEGVSWEEAKKLQDANISATGDQVILVGAASKGIIQRGFQHNATVYKTPYAKNPFDAVTDQELEDYKKNVIRKQKGDSSYDEDQSESEALSSSAALPPTGIKSPASETEEESRDEPQVLRIQTSQAPRPSQPEVVLSDEPESPDSDLPSSFQRSKSARYPEPVAASPDSGNNLNRTNSLGRDKAKSKDCFNHGAVMTQVKFSELPSPTVVELEQSSESKDCFRTAEDNRDMASNRTQIHPKPPLTTNTCPSAPQKVNLSHVTDKTNNSCFAYCANTVCLCCDNDEKSSKNNLNMPSNFCPRQLNTTQLNSEIIAKYSTLNHQRFNNDGQCNDFQKFFSSVDLENCISWTLRENNEDSDLCCKRVQGNLNKIDTGKTNKMCKSSYNSKVLENSSLNRKDEQKIYIVNNVEGPVLYNHKITPNKNMHGVNEKSLTEVTELHISRFHINKYDVSVENIEGNNKNKTHKTSTPNKSVNTETNDPLQIDISSVTVDKDNCELFGVEHPIELEDEITELTGFNKSRHEISNSDSSSGMVYVYEVITTENDKLDGDKIANNNGLCIDEENNVSESVNENNKTCKIGMNADNATIYGNVSRNINEICKITTVNIEMFDEHDKKNRSGICKTIEYFDDALNVNEINSETKYFDDALNVNEINSETFITSENFKNTELNADVKEYSTWKSRVTDVEDGNVNEDNSGRYINLDGNVSEDNIEKYTVADVVYENVSSNNIEKYIVWDDVGEKVGEDSIEKYTVVDVVYENVSSNNIEKYTVWDDVGDIVSEDDNERFVDVEGEKVSEDSIEKYTVADVVNENVTEDNNGRCVDVEDRNTSEGKIESTVADVVTDIVSDDNNGRCVDVEDRNTSEGKIEKYTVADVVNENVAEDNNGRCVDVEDRNTSEGKIESTVADVVTDIVSDDNNGRCVDVEDRNTSEGKIEKYTVADVVNENVTEDNNGRCVDVEDRNTSEGKIESTVADVVTDIVSDDNNGRCVDVEDRKTSEGKIEKYTVADVVNENVTEDNNGRCVDVEDRNTSEGKIEKYTVADVVNENVTEDNNGRCVDVEDRNTSEGKIESTVADVVTDIVSDDNNGRCVDVEDRKTSEGKIEKYTVADVVNENVTEDNNGRCVDVEDRNTSEGKIESTVADVVTDIVSDDNNGRCVDVEDRKTSEGKIEKYTVADVVNENVTEDNNGRCVDVEDRNTSEGKIESTVADVVTDIVSDDNNGRCVDVEDSKTSEGKIKKCTVADVVNENVTEDNNGRCVDVEDRNTSEGKIEKYTVADVVNENVTEDNNGRCVDVEDRNTSEGKIEKHTVADVVNENVTEDNNGRCVDVEDRNTSEGKIEKHTVADVVNENVTEDNNGRCVDVEDRNTSEGKIEKYTEADVVNENVTEDNNGRCVYVEDRNTIEGKIEKYTVADVVDDIFSEDNNGRCIYAENKNVSEENIEKYTFADVVNENVTSNNIGRCVDVENGNVEKYIVVDVTTVVNEDNIEKYMGADATDIVSEDNNGRYIDIGDGNVSEDNIEQFTVPDVVTDIVSEGNNGSCIDIEDGNASEDSIGICPYIEDRNVSEDDIELYMLPDRNVTGNNKDGCTIRVDVHKEFYGKCTIAENVGNTEVSVDVNKNVNENNIGSSTFSEEMDNEVLTVSGITVLTEIEQGINYLIGDSGNALSTAIHCNIYGEVKENSALCSTREDDNLGVNVNDNALCAGIEENVYDEINNDDLLSRIVESSNNSKISLVNDGLQEVEENTNCGKFTFNGSLYEIKIDHDQINKTEDKIVTAAENNASTEDINYRKLYDTKKDSTCGIFNKNNNELNETIAVEDCEKVCKNNLLCSVVQSIDNEDLNKNDDGQVNKLDNELSVGIEKLIKNQDIFPVVSDDTTNNTLHVVIDNNVHDRLCVVPESDNCEESIEKQSESSLVSEKNLNDVDKSCDTLDVYDMICEEFITTNDIDTILEDNGCKELSISSDGENLVLDDTDCKESYKNYEYLAIMSEKYTIEEIPNGAILSEQINKRDDDTTIPQHVVLEDNICEKFNQNVNNSILKNILCEKISPCDDILPEVLNNSNCEEFNRNVETLRAISEGNMFNENRQSVDDLPVASKSSGSNKINMKDNRLHLVLKNGESATFNQNHDNCCEEFNLSNEMLQPVFKDSDLEQHKESDVGFDTVSKDNFYKDPKENDGSHLSSNISKNNFIEMQSKSLITGKITYLQTDEIYLKNNITFHNVDSLEEVQNVNIVSELDSDKEHNINTIKDKSVEEINIATLREGTFTLQNKHNENNPIAENDIIVDKVQNDFPLDCTYKEFVEGIEKNHADDKIIYPLKYVENCFGDCFNGTGEQNIHSLSILSESVDSLLELLDGDDLKFCSSGETNLNTSPTKYNKTDLKANCKIQNNLNKSQNLFLDDLENKCNTEPISVPDGEKIYLENSESYDSNHSQKSTEAVCFSYQDFSSDDTDISGELTDDEIQVDSSSSPPSSSSLALYVGHDYEEGNCAAAQQLYDIEREPVLAKADLLLTPPNSPELVDGRDKFKVNAMFGIPEDPKNLTSSSSTSSDGINIYRKEENHSTLKSKLKIKYPNICLSSDSFLKCETKNTILQKNEPDSDSRIPTFYVVELGNSINNKNVSYKWPDQKHAFQKLNRCKESSQTFTCTKREQGPSVMLSDEHNSRYVRSRKNIFQKFNCQKNVIKSNRNGAALEKVSSSFYNYSDSLSDISIDTSYQSQDFNKIVDSESNHDFNITNNYNIHTCKPLSEDVYDGNIPLTDTPKSKPLSEDVNADNIPLALNRSGIYHTGRALSEALCDSSSSIGSNESDTKLHSSQTLPPDNSGYDADFEITTYFDNNFSDITLGDISLNMESNDSYSFKKFKKSYINKRQIRFKQHNNTKNRDTLKALKLIKRNPSKELSYILSSAEENVSEMAFISKPFVDKDTEINTPSVSATDHSILNDEEECGSSKSDSSRLNLANIYQSSVYSPVLCSGSPTLTRIEEEEEEGENTYNGDHSDAHQSTFSHSSKEGSPTKDISTEDSPKKDKKKKKGLRTPSFLKKKKEKKKMTEA